MKKIIGVFGPSGGGKSTFCEGLKAYGVSIIEADKIGKAILEQGTLALAQVAEVFGKEILFPDGSLNRKKLGALVFSNEEALEKLNQITLPLLEEGMLQELEALQGVIAIDCALLPQTRLLSLCQERVYIWADQALQIQRLMKRDGLSKNGAAQRIETQNAEFSRVATLEIQNNGDLESLKKEAERLYRRMNQDEKE